MVCVPGLLADPTYVPIRQEVTLGMVMIDSTASSALCCGLSLASFAFAAIFPFAAATFSATRFVIAFSSSFVP